MKLNNTIRNHRKKNNKKRMNTKKIARFLELPQEVVSNEPKITILRF